MGNQGKMICIRIKKQANSSWIHIFDAFSLKRVTYEFKALNLECFRKPPFLHTFSAILILLNYRKCMGKPRFSKNQGEGKLIPIHSLKWNQNDALTTYKAIVAFQTKSVFSFFLLNNIPPQSLDYAAYRLRLAETINRRRSWSELEIEKSFAANLRKVKVPSKYRAFSNRYDLFISVLWILTLNLRCWLIIVKLSEMLLLRPRPHEDDCKRKR